MIYLVCTLQPFSYQKRKLAERDLLATKEIEKQIKDEIKDKLVGANKQRQVCISMWYP